MTRREAVIYLMDNPSGNLKMIRNNEGELVTDVYVRMSINGDIMCGDYRMVLYAENDKSEFEIVRELKQMIFVDAIKLIIDSDLYMNPVGSNIRYNDQDSIFNLEHNDIDKLWNVEGVYEDTQPTIDKWTPKPGEFFYYLDFIQLNGYNGGNYEPHIDKHDSSRVEWGFIAKTKEEIIELRDKVSAFIGK